MSVLNKPNSSSKAKNNCLSMRSSTASSVRTANNNKPKKSGSSRKTSVLVPPWQSLYPWPDKSERFKRERSFILDGIALSSLQESFGQINPKLGSAIPPYNSQFDKSTNEYFKFKGVQKTLNKTKQSKNVCESIEGKYVDHFHHKGRKHDYLNRRNMHGAGHSGELIDGHSRFMSEITEMNGYNGHFGFRRNVPTLRKYPTTFGVTDRTFVF